MENTNIISTEESQLEQIAADNSIKEFRNKVQIFTKLLNEKPKPEKIKQHQGYDYLPISTVEKELDRIFFGLVQYECISYQQIFNEIACHARIKVFHPVINQWMQYDGLGSAVIQQDAGSKVSDFNATKKANALQLTLPKAYAEAIKNAAKKIGKRFGADINRKFEDEYIPLQAITQPEKPRVKITRPSPQWSLLIKDLNDGVTIEEIEKKVELTTEQREQLMEDALC